ncbi:zf-CCHC domain-containing protein [Tanacetum coccineum]
MHLMTFMEVAKPKWYERALCSLSRFNTIITSPKALDEFFSRSNHVRKFLRALPTKWRPKVTAIEESNDLSTLLLDELIGNIKVYEVVLEKDSEASKNKKEKYKSLALKAKKEKEKFVRQPHDDKKAFRKAKEDKNGKVDRKCFKCGVLNHFISDWPKHSYNDQKAFVGGSWNDSDEDVDLKKDEICLVAHESNEVHSDTLYYSSSSLDDETLQNEYNKLCKISLKLEKNKGINEECTSCLDLDANGITHNFSAPRTPRSNRVVERRNRTYGFN